jgi:hypothetical protein
LPLSQSSSSAGSTPGRKRRKPAPLPPPTDEERETARAAAAAMRAVIADRSKLGDESVFHADFASPRRGVWYKRWSGVPGLCRVACSRDGVHYSHDCLPGWTYKRHEIKREMIPDLEALAGQGVRPTEATS